MKNLFLFANLATILSLLMTACVTISDVALEAKPTTPQLRNAIAQAARDVLFDPYSVRDAEISNLVNFPGGQQAVCVRLNSKNQLGGYTGRQSQAVYIKSGRPVAVGVNPQLCNNAQLKWSKFPEIEALRNI